MFTFKIKANYTFCENLGYKFYLPEQISKWLDSNIGTDGIDWLFSSKSAELYFRKHNHAILFKLVNNDAII
jgi:hypothetical protein